MDELEEIRKKKLEELKMEMTKPKEVITEVDDENFQEKVIEKSKETPVVADFWAQWCQACVMLSPILEKLAKEYNGKFILAKANVDTARKAAESYGVMSIPSVKLFKNGEVIDEFIGAIPELSVKKWLEKNLE